MKTLRVRADGSGAPRLESLPLPFVAPGPTATESDRALSPDPGSFNAVSSMRASSAAAGWVGEASGRRLILMVSGSLRVAVPQMQARIGPGDVLLLEPDDSWNAGTRLRAETDVQMVEVTLHDAWSPDGVVPPAIEEARRGARSTPRLTHLHSRDEVAHLESLVGLFDLAAEQELLALSFVCLSPGMTSDWHTEPGVSLLVVLAGGFTVEVGGDGGQTTLRAGDVCLVEDFDGQGHRSSSDGETRFAVLGLPKDHCYGVRA